MVDDTNDSMNRRDDQLQFETTQLANTKAVYEGIREKDDMKIFGALGVVPPDPEDGDPDRPTEGDEKRRKPTPQEQFAEHLSKLTIALKYSESLPAELTQEWMAKLKGIEIGKPIQGLDVLKALTESYSSALKQCRPRRDIFNLAIHETMRFEDEMQEIRQELEWLRKILTHVQVKMIEAAFDKLP